MAFGEKSEMPREKRQLSFTVRKNRQKTSWTRTKEGLTLFCILSTLTITGRAIFQLFHRVKGVWRCLPNSEKASEVLSFLVYQLIFLLI